jgi:hypothetical protein
MTLSVVCWKWKRPGGDDLFGPEYVNRLRSMLDRHLHLPHALYCITDDAAGIDSDVRIVPMPTEFAETARCRRRMWQFARERFVEFGDRMLCTDLDLVIVDDITPIVDRREAIVCWRVGYAGVYSGSFLMFDTGALDGAWQTFRRNPAAYMKATRERNASDQAMLNLHLGDRRIGTWTEADGFVTWFGNGYARLERHGMGPGRPGLPPGARIVVLGSADKHVMDERRYDFVRDHWR